MSEKGKDSVVHVDARTRDGYDVSAHTRSWPGSGGKLSSRVDAMSDFKKEPESKNVKDALDKLGYDKEENTITAMIKQLQKDNKLKVDGYMEPDGESITKLNEIMRNPEGKSRVFIPKPDTSDMTTRQLLEGFMSGKLPITKTDPETGFKSRYYNGREEEKVFTSTRTLSDTLAFAGVLPDREKYHPKDLNFSKEGAAFLLEEESKVMRNGKHVIYDDKTGKPVPKATPLPKGATIGYGHLIKPGEDFSQGLTEQEAQDLYRKDVKEFEYYIKSYIHAPITQRQYDALIPLIFNIGPGNFQNSTVRKYINDPNFKSHAYPNLEAAWKSWNIDDGKISNGLINRRDHEWILFNQ